LAATAVAAVVGALAAAIPVPLIADAATWLTGGAAWLPLRGLILTGTVAASLPLAALPVGGGSWLTVSWYPLLGMLARHLSRRPSPVPPTAQPLTPTESPIALPEAAAFGAALGWVARPRRAALAVALVLGLATFLTGPDGRLHLTILDIGQGDGILVEAPDGTTAIIDGGLDPDLTLRRLGEELPFHQRRIDVLLSTHPDLDHIGGLGEVLRRYHVGLVLDNGRPPETHPHRRLLGDARVEPGATIHGAQAGQVIQLGAGAGLEILFPSATDLASPVPDDDRNNTSVVALVQYGRFTAILTGDAEAPVETLLAVRGLLGPVDVLKVGHHGSRSSTTADFLAAIEPAIAVISVGADNTYGHPHPTVLDNLAGIYGLEVYRTDLDGSVEVVTDGQAYWIISRRGQTAPRSARGKAAYGDAPVEVRTGRIEPWPCPIAQPRAACSLRTIHPTGWSSTPRESRESRLRRRGHSRPT
jgi:competence protein ComEC